MGVAHRLNGVPPSRCELRCETENSTFPHPSDAGGYELIVPLQVVSGECLIYAFYPNPEIQKFVGLFTVVIAFVIPLMILIYCYGRILWVLTRRLDSQLNNTGTQSDVFQLARKNTVKTFLIVAVCFVICWSNNQIYYIMDHLGFHANWNGTYYKFTVLMVFLNCTVNPFIYLVNYQDYQKALKSWLGCLIQENTEERKSNTANINSITQQSQF